MKALNPIFQQLAEAQRLARAEVDRCLAAYRVAGVDAAVPVYWTKRGQAAGSASCPQGRATRPCPATPWGTATAMPGCRRKSSERDC